MERYNSSLQKSVIDNTGKYISSADVRVYGGISNAISNEEVIDTISTYLFGNKGFISHPG